MQQNILNHARSYIGAKEGDYKHKEIIDKYNAIRPLPVGYKAKLTDEWCAIFLTVIGDLSGASTYFGRECGVQRFIRIFKDKAIWLGLVKPKPGDIIVFDWQKDGWGDHIGIVEQVNGNQVTTIEGNTSKSVARRTYAYNHWRIAGYARPNYPSSGGTKKTINDLAHEVINQKWGNGNDRTFKLSEAGYNAELVQREVNRILNTRQQGTKSNEAIAKEVINTSKWGNGQVRKQRLADAGYDYQIIQNLVNKLIN
ncbi:CHAP domain-containing protein [Alkalibacterium sp. MB6]|uniref:CHAP domain-containing protein n=1 Tax=Alkalibacterium sp. MB6 TaxID=2081965 RepID=UPI00137B6F40|nr:CHAP domain-containing protein [Alkalibacterium sp. MB6]